MYFLGEKYTKVTLWEGMVQPLHRAMGDLVWYLGQLALVSEIFSTLELEYGTMASFHILIQNSYKLQQGKTEKSHIVCNLIGGGTECGTTGISDNVEC